jgi:lysophospholipase L1-like esterase
VFHPLSAADGPGALRTLLTQLKTSQELGVPYLEDDLRAGAQPRVDLMIHTQLEDPGQCGRGPDGWTVNAVPGDTYTYVTLRKLPMLGNRSQLAQFSFKSTQVGIAPGEHGLVEMRLCGGTTNHGPASPDDLPVRIRVENGRFYILGLNGDSLLAGDREHAAFTPSIHTVYTLTTLLFRKGIFARVSGADIPGGAVELVVPDRHRFIPGRPGFGVQPNSHATGGGLTIFDWTVTPVGPADYCRLAAIGDSITAGIDLGPEAESYVAIATRALGQELVLNTGSGGSNTALDLDRFPCEVAPFRPEIVWIEGGTNDIGTGHSADEAFANLQREAALVTWGGMVVFSTVPPRPLATAAQYDELLRLNRLIRESGRPFVDRYALVVDPANPRQIRAEYRFTDGIHITAPGCAAIGAAAAKLFQELRKPAPTVPGHF